ncbi:MAG: calcium-translocating P-type ATPase, PMCA-type [Oscillospiraceae bacterium]|jgi:Ca2+-transporting ATPase|nr:calcium-translocating P-type ATPase, PMCA-type [Oscillospiraceae bacterium]
MDYHAIPKEEAVKILASDAQTGLSAKEAAARLEKYGENKLTGQKKASFLVRFLAQFKDFCVIALIISAIISAAATLMNGSHDFLDSIIIIGIVVVNSLVGVIQEGRAEKALEALKKLSAPRAEVLRGGERLSVPSEELVPGDIIFLHTGDLVPADALLLEAASLSTQEAALTGESLPCSKRADLTLPEETPLAERKNMALSSTVVLTGHGKALVTATGMGSQLGKIAGMLAEEETPQTPLQNRLEKVGKQLGIGAMVISALVFVLSLIQHMAVLDGFMLGVSLAVAAIPEGLPAMVTVVLSIGVQRMAKQNAIVRRLPAVETLGCASVICSDKTGTLTQNRMQVPMARSAKKANEKEHGIWTPGGSAEEEKDMLTLAALCCNATLEKDGKDVKALGEPTETAIIDAADKLRIPVMTQRREWARLFERPFDSAKKRMGVVVNLPHGGEAPLAGKTMIVKGAPDVLLNLCSRVRDGLGEKALDAAAAGQIAAQNEAMAKRALRVLAVAVKPVSGLPENASEEQLTFLGLIGMQDPPRREAKAAVATAKRAGITTIMITGDHVTTAEAIARDIGIIDSMIDPCKAALTGNEVDGMDDPHLIEALRFVRVIARAAPAHKLRVVKLLRSQKQVVAMTGDGVNDAPALKAADIGCAMGRSGTEVAKGASDMILTDDNFATIVRAIEEGRTIYDNIKKAVHFLISSNIGEIVAVFFASLMKMHPPLLPIQLLWINVVTDSAPAIALGMEKPEKHIMLRRPKPPEEHFWNLPLAFHMAVEGLLMGSVVLLAFVLGERLLGGLEDIALGQTMAFSVMSFVEIMHANNSRSERSLFAIGPFSNGRMNFANVLCAGLQLAVVMIPALAENFGCVAMNLPQWLTVIGLSLLPTFVMECEKTMLHVSNKRKKAKGGNN